MTASSNVAAGAFSPSAPSYQLLRIVTCHEVSRRQFAQLGFAFSAIRAGNRATRMKVTARWRVGWAWHVAFQDDPVTLPGRVGDRHG
jgi:hypothetical protein